jgi:hypothetical protein
MKIISTFDCGYWKKLALETNLSNWSRKLLHFNRGIGTIKRVFRDFKSNLIGLFFAKRSLFSRFAVEESQCLNSQ